jgi:DNA helicase HerA-like ATPase
LLDLKDLRAMLQFVGENAKQFTTEYGNISAASVGAIQRGLLSLETQGGDQLFGEPMLNIEDLMQTDKGKGVINILAADKLMQAPKMYATLLLWLLSELFENLPEAGDLDKPKLVFFFDEAHLLFNDAPTALVDKIEQVGRRRLFRLPEPDRRAGQGAVATGQPRATRLASLLATRPESGEGSC